MVDVEADTIGLLYEQMEKINAALVNWFIDHNYCEAVTNNYQRFINWVTSNQAVSQEYRLTAPNTQEQQEYLMKVYTAGQYFHITGGGG